ncbi:uncharacterized protein LOC142351750 isoform X2 [Convolutriloba macropyga]
MPNHTSASSSQSARDKKVAAQNIIGSDAKCYWKDVNCKKTSKRNPDNYDQIAIESDQQAEPVEPLWRVTPRHLNLFLSSSDTSNNQQNSFDNILKREVSTISIVPGPHKPNLRLSERESSSGFVRQKTGFRVNSEEKEPEQFRLHNEERTLIEVWKTLLERHHALQSMKN